MTLLLSIAAALLCSLISLLGIILLGLREFNLKKVMLLLVAFSSGTMLGTAFLHLIPESLELTGENTFIFILLGICIFFIVEKLLNWRHCHDIECDVHPFAYMNLVGDGLHNFLDGIIIASSFLVSLSLGITTTIAVIYHEIPQEIGDFGVLLHGGFSKKQALTLNLLSGLISIIGVLAAFYIYSLTNLMVNYFLPIAAAGFIYIAGSDLIPQLHKKNNIGDSITQLLLIIMGIVLMWGFKFLFIH
ncbi:MAG: Zinc transporter ZupT [candidate division WS2 bacterium]|nr:Zinc transporter ZupT [Candidatus Lithacetigena glycinireducens]